MCAKHRRPFNSGNEYREVIPTPTTMNNDKQRLCRELTLGSNSHHRRQVNGTLTGILWRPRVAALTVALLALAFHSADGFSGPGKAN